MCGIAGFWGPGSIEPMLESIRHRGPDHGAMMTTPSGALGIRRLRIIDLSADQPIFNENHDVAIVYNGEVFNYRCLRDQLQSKGHIFKTLSDTEVVVHAYEEWGDRCVDRFNGQFAFAIWDGRGGRDRFYIARDRMGEKPLYYLRRGSCLVFASEIKAILTQIQSKPCIDDAFFAFEMPPEGETLFEGVRELPPATYMTFDGDTLRHVNYWRIPCGEVDDRPSEEQARDLRDLLCDAVLSRMVADVPVGIALSGGIDSAAIACIAKPDIAFSCRFPLGPRFDEWEYADLIARHVGCEHVTVIPTANNLRTTLPEILWYLDQPVATASPIGDFMVAEEASKRVKVLLGGQGSDECFGGYSRYLVALSDRAAALAAPELANYHPMIRHFWERRNGDATEGYFHLLNRGACREPSRHLETVRTLYRSMGNPVDAMGYTDIHLTLPALIHMNDRSSAAYGVENRNPFLDHRLVEFAYRLPPDRKIDGFTTKSLLRKALRGIVPDAILDRRDKKGLVVPIRSWLDGPLASWRDDLLGSLAQRFPYKASASRGEFDRHDYTGVCLELWFRRFFPDWRAA